MPIVLYFSVCYQLNNARKLLLSAWAWACVKLWTTINCCSIYSFSHIFFFIFIICSYLLFCAKFLFAHTLTLIILINGFLFVFCIQYSYISTIQTTIRNTHSLCHKHSSAHTYGSMMENCVNAKNGFIFLNVELMCEHLRNK